MSDEEMRRDDERADRDRGYDDEMDVDMDDPSIQRKGRGFNIRGASTAEADGVRSKDFDRLHADKEEDTRAVRSIEGWIILVTNVHEEATEEDVLDKFADFGQVKNCHLNLDRRTGYVKGYALLEYEHYEDAKEAIEACASPDGLQLMEEDLRADFAFVKPPHGVQGARGQRRGAPGARADTRARSPGRR